MNTLPFIKSEYENEIINLDDDELLDPYSLWEKEILHVLIKALEGKSHLEDSLRYYNKTLEKLRSCKSKSSVKEKIFRHITYFNEQFENYTDDAPSGYYELLEDTLECYCSLELECIRSECKQKPTDYVKRTLELGQKLCTVLTSCFKQKEAHIVHVLLKMKYNAKSDVCKKVMRFVYRHVLFTGPVPEFSAEAICRHYLLLLFYKDIMAQDLHSKLERIFFQQFKIEENYIENNDFIKNVLNPRTESMVDSLVFIMNLKENLVQSYFTQLEISKKLLARSENLLPIGNELQFQEEQLCPIVFGSNLALCNNLRPDPPREIVHYDEVDLEEEKVKTDYVFCIPSDDEDPDCEIMFIGYALKKPKIRQKQKVKAVQSEAICTISLDSDDETDNILEPNKENAVQNSASTNNLNMSFTNSANKTSKYSSTYCAVYNTNSMTNDKNSLVSELSEITDINLNKCDKNIAIKTLTELRTNQKVEDLKQNASSSVDQPTKSSVKDIKIEIATVSSDNSTGIKQSIDSTVIEQIIDSTGKEQIIESVEKNAGQNVGMETENNSGVELRNNDDNINEETLIAKEAVAAAMSSSVDKGQESNPVETRDIEASTALENLNLEEENDFRKDDLNSSLMEIEVETVGAILDNMELVSHTQNASNLDDAGIVLQKKSEAENVGEKNNVKNNFQQVLDMEESITLQRVEQPHSQGLLENKSDLETSTNTLLKSSNADLTKTPDEEINFNKTASNLITTEEQIHVDFNEVSLQDVCVQVEIGMEDVQYQSEIVETIHETDVATELTILQDETSSSEKQILNEVQFNGSFINRHVSLSTDNLNSEVNTNMYKNNGNKLDKKDHEDISIPIAKLTQEHIPFSSNNLQSNESPQNSILQLQSKCKEIVDLPESAKIVDSDLFNKINIGTEDVSNIIISNVVIDNATKDTSKIAKEPKLQNEIHRKTDRIVRRKDRHRKRSNKSEHKRSSIIESKTDQPVKEPINPSEDLIHKMKKMELTNQKSVSDSISSQYNNGFKNNGTIKSAVYPDKNRNKSLLQKSKQENLQNQKLDLKRKVYPPKSPKKSRKDLFGLEKPDSKLLYNPLTPPRDQNSDDNFQQSQVTNVIALNRVPSCDESFYSNSESNLNITEMDIEETLVTQNGTKIGDYSTFNNIIVNNSSSTPIKSLNKMDDKFENSPIPSLGHAVNNSLLTVQPKDKQVAKIMYTSDLMMPPLESNNNGKKLAASIQEFEYSLSGPLSRVNSNAINYGNCDIFDNEKVGFDVGWESPVKNTDLSRVSRQNESFQTPTTSAKKKVNLVSAEGNKKDIKYSRNVPKTGIQFQKPIEDSIESNTSGIQFKQDIRYVGTKPNTLKNKTAIEDNSQPSTSGTQTKHIAWSETNSITLIDTPSNYKINDENRLVAISNLDKNIEPKGILKKPKPVALPQSSRLSLDVHKAYEHLKRKREAKENHPSKVRITAKPMCPPNSPTKQQYVCPWNPRIICKDIQEEDPKLSQLRAVVKIMKYSEEELREQYLRTGSAILSRLDMKASPCQVPDPADYLNHHPITGNEEDTKLNRVQKGRGKRKNVTKKIVQNKKALPLPIYKRKKT